MFFVKIVNKIFNKNKIIYYATIVILSQAQLAHSMELEIGIAEKEGAERDRELAQWGLGELEGMLLEEKDFSEWVHRDKEETEAERMRQVERDFAARERWIGEEAERWSVVSVPGCVVEPVAELQAVQLGSAGMLFMEGFYDKELRGKFYDLIASEIFKGDVFQIFHNTGSVGPQTYISRVDFKQCKDLRYNETKRRGIMNALAMMCNANLEIYSDTSRYKDGSGIIIIHSHVNNPKWPFIGLRHESYRHESGVTHYYTRIEKHTYFLKEVTILDLPLLKKYKEKPDIDLAQTCKGINNSLCEALEIEGAIAYLPVYKTNTDLVIYHINLLEWVKKCAEKAKDNKNLMIQVFLEFTRFKMALQCFSEIPFKRNSLGKCLDCCFPWLSRQKMDEVQWRLVRIAITGQNGILKNIDHVRQYVLSELTEENENIDFKKTIFYLEMVKKRNEKKILTLQNTDNISILSCAGGGIRGKVASLILRHMASEGVTILDKFDYFAGTSVGGLIVSALNIPNPIDPSKGKFDTNFVAGLLEGDTAARIFPPIHWLLKGFYQFNSYAYDEKSLEDLLIPNFGINTLLSDMVKPTLLVANNPQTGKPVYLKSYGPESKNIRAWEGARATSAAPSYFPPMAVYYNNDITLLEDGGVTENNPTFAALDEVGKLLKQGNKRPKRMNVLYIGTGTPEKKSKFGAGDVGAMSHKNVLEASMDANSAKTEKLVLERIKVLRNKGIIINYYHLNPSLTESIELDDSSEPNLEKLREAASGIIKSPLYAQILNSLKGSPDDGASKFIKIWGPGKNDCNVTYFQ